MRTLYRILTGQVESPGAVQPEFFAEPLLPAFNQVNDVILIPHHIIKSGNGKRGFLAYGSSRFNGICRGLLGKKIVTFFGIGIHNMPEDSG